MLMRLCCVFLRLCGVQEIELLGVHVVVLCWVLMRLCCVVMVMLGVH